MTIEFRKFNKIYRYDDELITVTEKIDGSNGVIFIDIENDLIMAGSRERWLTLENDNDGFYNWVKNNKEELMKLGNGYHYGEWWGQGIKRKYNMSQKVFSLFNTKRWGAENKPSCCDVVPVLFTGTHAEFLEINSKELLQESKASQAYNINYTKTEGLMIYFKNSEKYMKLIFNKK